MYYRREGRRRRYEEEEPAPDRGWRGRPRRFGGGRFTFFSFVAVMICLALVKASRPDISLHTPLVMLGGVGVGCAIMSFVARRMK